MFFKGISQIFNERWFIQCHIFHSGNGDVEFDEFLQMMAKQMQCTDSPDELIEAFQVFDETKSGLISVAEFRSVMTTLGERLTDDDVDEMIADTGLGGNGYIRYKGTCILNTSVNFID